MIKRLLIANRGEIALRIIRACRELRIETVAVYSEADRRSPHVAAADCSIAIGPPPATDSYLSIPRVLEAVRSTRADAVHPGYGFLSENPAFAAACEKEGVVFVGPPSTVIARMGSKIDARRVMDAAGIPVVPGEAPEDQSDSGLRRAIERVGLPVLVKAAAGGGGRGMRRILEKRGIDEAVQASRREATAAFGDGTLYAEKLIDRPRHIEVQVFADHHGHVVHLFERECSVQRRHQKIIEESPSPALTVPLRASMTGVAVDAARAAGYRNAGTIEFLVEGTGDNARFYFLEMNTRLQVEHPVTEQVAGVDLVRAQLLVAAGESLPWTESMLVQRGHVIEARVYAEDPSHGFVPQAGPLLLYREPQLPGIRIDSGVVEGSEVSVHYDPMIAKIIATAESRPIAISRLVAALRDYPILGVPTNASFLLRILEHPRFHAGEIDTTFLDGEGASLADGGEAGMPPFVRAVMMAREDESRVPNPESRARDPWQTLRGWRM